MEVPCCVCGQLLPVDDPETDYGHTCVLCDQWVCEDCSQNEDGVCDTCFEKRNENK